MCTGDGVLEEIRNLEGMGAGGYNLIGGRSVRGRNNKPGREWRGV